MKKNAEKEDERKEYDEGMKRGSLMRRNCLRRKRKEEEKEKEKGTESTI